jgi:hypothetical protein
VIISDWLRWPRLWYATPTFVLFIALQAPDWRFTARVWIALVVWAIAGVGIDVWMTRHQRDHPSQKKDVDRLINSAMAFGFALALCAIVLRPAADSVGHGAIATGLNVALEGLGVLLPSLDIFHRELLEMGRFNYAAYLGSFFVLVVVTWVPGFFLFYRAFASLSPADFAKAVAAKKDYGSPPYGGSQKLMALGGLSLMAVLLPGMLLLFGRVLPIDAQSGVGVGQAYLVLSWAGWIVNLCLYVFHSCRRFLATMQPSGYLPAGDSDHDERR